MCLEFLYRFLQNFFFHSKKKWTRYDKKCVLVFILSDFNETWIFFRQIFEKYSQISRFMEFCPVGAELFHEDKRVDLTRVIDILQNCSAKSTKMTKTAPRTKFQSTDKLSTKPQG
jgi:hypothetical protein